MVIILLPRGRRLYIVFAALLLTASLVVAESIPLREIDVLVFERDANTEAARRMPSVPQLQCTGDARLCRYHAPASVECRNIGSEGSVVHWQCTAQFPIAEAVRLDRVHIECEGLDYPGDPVVLVGSCALQYSLASARHSTVGDGLDDRAQMFIVSAVVLLFIAFAAMVVLVCSAEARDCRAPATTASDDYVRVTGPIVEADLYTVVDVAPTKAPSPPSMHHCHCHRDRDRESDCGFFEGVVVASLLSGGGGSGSSSSSGGGGRSWGSSSAFGSSSSR